MQSSPFGKLRAPSLSRGLIATVRFAHLAMTTQTSQSRIMRSSVPSGSFVGEYSWEMKPV